MSAKIDKIGTLAETPGLFHVTELHQQAQALDLSRILLVREINSAFRPRLWQESDEAKRTPLASWENISFVMLWLCGIGGIGLAFL